MAGQHPTITILLNAMMTAAVIIVPVGLVEPVIASGGAVMTDNLIVLGGAVTAVFAAASVSSYNRKLLINGSLFSNLGKKICIFVD